MTFFIFCLHEPVLTFIEKIGQPWATTNWHLMILFLLNPLVVLCFSILTYKILKKFVPSPLAILMGHRVKPEIEKTGKAILDTK